MFGLGLWFRVWGSGFRVGVLVLGSGSCSGSGLGFGVQGLGCRLQDLEWKVVHGRGEEADRGFGIRLGWDGVGMGWGYRGMGGGQAWCTTGSLWSAPWTSFRE